MLQSSHVVFSGQFTSLGDYITLDRGGGGVPLHPEVAEGASRGQSHQWQEHEGSKRLFPIHLSQEPENYEVSVSPDFHCPPHDHRRFW